MAHTLPVKLKLRAAPIKNTAQRLVVFFICLCGESEFTQLWHFVAGLQLNKWLEFMLVGIKGERRADPWSCRSKHDGRNAANGRQYSVSVLCLALASLTE